MNKELRQEMKRVERIFGVPLAYKNSVLLIRKENRIVYEGSEDDVMRFLKRFEKAAA